MKLWRISGSFAATSLLLMLSACISVNKDANGNDKNVKVDTPLGGVHVHTGDVVAADVGLPVYPGATKADKKGDQPADIRAGFGQWQFRMKVVKYHSPDSQEKILAFYKKAMGRYGDVVECNHDSAVGEPTSTREGLSCHGGHAKDGSPKIRVNNPDNSPMRVMAGSEQHQHIVGVDRWDASGTDFALIVLDLPSQPNTGSDAN